MTEPIAEEQFGVRYVSGLEDWNTTSWFGSIETAEQRETFAEQYRLRMASFGVPDATVQFLRRTKTTLYSPVDLIDDSAAPDLDQEPVPEPEPEAPAEVEVAG